MLGIVDERKRHVTAVVEISVVGLIGAEYARLDGIGENVYTCDLVQRDELTLGSAYSAHLNGLDYSGSPDLEIVYAQVDAVDRSDDVGQDHVGWPGGPGASGDRLIEFWEVAFGYGSAKVGQRSGTRQKIAQSFRVVSEMRITSIIK